MISKHNIPYTGSQLLIQDVAFVQKEDEIHAGKEFRGANGLPKED